MAACSGNSTKPRKTHLARLPAAVGQIAIADDATSWAFVERDGDRGRVIHDGRPGDWFPDFVGLTFSPVTRKLFYWAGSATEGWLVTERGRFGNFGRDGLIVFTADGARWATAAGTRERMVGSVIEPGTVVVLADDAELGRYRDASPPAFSPDGRHLAYLATDEAQGARLIVDGAERARYRAAGTECGARRRPDPRGPSFWPQFQVQYLSDGSLVAMTQDDDGWGVYRDGRRVAAYAASLTQSRPFLLDSCATGTAIAAWTLTAAEKAPVVAWWERLEGTGDRWRVVVDGKPVDDVVCSAAWIEQPPAFSPDGRRMAYACRVREPLERVFLVVDGRRYGPYLDLWAHVWSDDGAHFAYGAADESTTRQWRYYVDGVARTEPLAAVWRPRLEAGTGRLGWEGMHAEGDRGFLGIDGRRIVSFDAVLWGPTFLRPGIATWVVRRGRWLTRIDAPAG